MKTINLTAACLALLLLGACAAPKTENPQITRLKTEFERLASHPELGPRGGDELKRAESALRRLSDAKRNPNERELDLALFTTERLIRIAEFEARARWADSQRAEMVLERERLVTAARTREAQQARQMANEAREQAAAAIALKDQAQAETLRAEETKLAAENARRAAEEAQMMAVDKQRLAEEAAQSAMGQAELARQAAQAQTAEAEKARLAAEAARADAAQARAEVEAARLDRERMQSKLADLEARQTERGLLLTLGDVLFEFNRSDLKPGFARNLTPLVEVLKERPKQSVIVEGHTDSVGGKDYNLALSERRAAAVRDHLVNSGIATDRIRVAGLGPDLPVATNDTPEGRQRNRRVEVILPNIEAGS